MTVTNTDIARRLMNKFTVDDGCWVWHASLNDAGYGQIATGPGKSPARAHRVMYELLVGPIPDGLTIDHLCQNRACVNPGHMEVVTRGENARRGGGLEVSNARRRAQTHCKRGHLLDEASTYTYRGCRRCRVCRRKGTA